MSEIEAAAISALINSLCDMTKNVNGPRADMVVLPKLL